MADKKSTDYFCIEGVFLFLLAVGVIGAGVVYAAIH
jgi:hypothetical protein